MAKDKSATNTRAVKKELKAPKKKYFKLEYPTVIAVLEDLEEQEYGEYFKAICNHELYGEEPESFSNRAVRMAYNMTIRELDFQMEKHLRNVEQGRENQKGKGKKKDSEPSGSRQDEVDGIGTDLSKALTADQLIKLESKFPNFSGLLDEVQEQVSNAGIQVHSPMNYIIKYAEETDWNNRFKDEVDKIAGGIFGLD